MDDQTPETSNGEKVFINEGAAKLTFSGGPTNAFYNPVQEFNRDLTVLVLRQFVADRLEAAARNQTVEPEETNGDGCPPAKKKKKWCEASEQLLKPVRILDALSASGLRAIRFAKEVPNVDNVMANDFSEHAVSTIRRNIADNGVEERVTAHFGDAVDVMMKHRALDMRFHAIDLDPYGGPSLFLDSAVQAVEDGGMLMVTCTDMAILCGNTPEACFTKYNSVPVRSESCHESALRIILRAIDSNANRYGRYIEPLLCVSIDFYIRVFVKVHTSVRMAKDSVLKLSQMFHCTGCGTHTMQPLLRKTVVGNSIKYTPAQGPIVNNKCEFCDHSLHVAGPIYTAPLHNLDFVHRLLKRVKDTPVPERFGTHSRLEGVLTVVSEELLDVPLYYSHTHLMSVVKTPSAKFLMLRSALLNAGYRMSITHCNAKGVKTDAPMHVLWDIIRQLSAQANVTAESPSFSENAPGKRILSVPPKMTANFRTHPDADAKSKRDGLLRFQINKGKNWGPKSKAKGSVNSKFAGVQVREKAPVVESNGE
uniref:tRNA (guanine(26)-N(2))-dimethyltransferase n=2 Tax=Plectus sambesii TaxID=2011161 RepID=A0A914X2W1_9BILA